MNRTSIFRGGSLMMALAAFGCGGGDVALEPVEMEGLEDNERVVELAEGMVLGDPDAPITIAEFGDFQCPGCGQFAGMVKPQLQMSYLSEGQVKFVYYDYPLVSIHPHAFLAARASRCAADQDRYWEYHDALFRNQATWARSSNPPLGLFEDYATQLGLDEGAFSSCLRSDRHAEAVTANLQLGNLLGVSGTPTVMISGGDGGARRLGDNSFQGIQAVVDELLAGLDSAGSGGQ